MTMVSFKEWFWSDQHLLHRKIYDLPFPAARDPGLSMRPFKSCEEADEFMISEYNRVVGPNDKVYFIGDVAMHKKGLAMLDRMKPGYKYLILGNHDTVAPIREYDKYFNKIYGVLYLRKQKCIVTHVPIHEATLKKFPEDPGPARWKYNLHGHYHDHHVTKNGVKDPRYINLSVECTDYRPLSWDEIVERYMS